MDEELLSIVKSIAKEDADFTAVTESFKGYVKDPLASIADRESAEKFIRNNPFLNSAYDSGISKGVDSFKARYTKDELPSIVAAERQRVISELNPEETKADKLEREFNEYKASVKANEDRVILKNELLTTFDKVKAGDVGFKAEDIEPFVSLGEKGVEQFVKLNDRLQEIVKTRIEEALKGKYNTGDPKQGEPVSDDFDFEAQMRGATSFRNK